MREILAHAAPPCQHGIRSGRYIGAARLVGAARVDRARQRARGSLGIIGIGRRNGARKRQQVIAEEAINLMKLRYPNLASDPNAVVIGLTDEDLFIRKRDSQYAFSYRAQRRFAVVSTARMDPANLGGAANEVLAEARLRKMVLKNIGVLYYLLPTNHDPNSVLYDDVGGVEDLDNMGEDF